MILLSNWDYRHEPPVSDLKNPSSMGCFRLIMTLTRGPRTIFLSQPSDDMRNLIGRKFTWWAVIIRTRRHQECLCDYLLKEKIKGKSIPITF
jgi:hypothetical protein